MKNGFIDGVTFLGFEDSNSADFWFILILFLLFSFVCLFAWCLSSVLCALIVSCFYSEDDCYKVTLDDSVSFTEFMEHYEILDYEDGIYTIKIKENE